ncbi:MAG: hypothetical protein ABIP08_01700 [Lautropia sp.]
MDPRFKVLGDLLVVAPDAGVHAVGPDVYLAVLGQVRFGPSGVLVKPDPLQAAAHRRRQVGRIQPDQLLERRADIGLQDCAQIQPQQRRIDRTTTWRPWRSRRPVKRGLCAYAGAAQAAERIEDGSKVAEYTGRVREITRSADTPIADIAQAKRLLGK